MTVKKKVFWITAFIIIAAIAIVLCFGYFNKKPSKYDGFLVKTSQEIPNIR